MNERLIKEFTLDEVKGALDFTGDLKAPRPGGLSAIFFKNFRDVVGGKVSTEVLEVLNGSKMLEGWNDTVIDLIPKVSKPDKVTDLRPVSLCNVVYKVV